MDDLANSLPARTRTALLKLAECARAAADRLTDVAATPISWSDGIPNSDSPGVYLIFDDEETLLYVGKSETAMGSRFWTHLVQIDEGFSWGSDAFQSRPALVATIPLGDCPALAPALEALLISELRPLTNRRGVPRGVDDAHPGAHG